jgi:hypothetical protein
MNYEAVSNNYVHKNAFDPSLRKTTEQLTENHFHQCSCIKKQLVFHWKMGVFEGEFQLHCCTLV